MYIFLYTLFNKNDKTSPDNKGIQLTLFILISYLCNSIFLNIMQVKSKQVEIEVIRKTNEEERVKLLDEV